MTMGRKIQAAFYVCPDGRDGNAGTSLDVAFASIERARDVVREINSNMTGDIVVYLAGGTYVMDDTLGFDQRDSGTNGYCVVYRAAPRPPSRQVGTLDGLEQPGMPVLSGAQRVGGWKKVEGSDIANLWSADVPEIENTRQLYVNGRRADMARGPEMRGEDLWKSSDDSQMAFHNQIETVDSFAADMPVYAGYKTTAKYAHMADWRNPSDIEFVYDVGWTRVIVAVEKIERTDDGGAVIEMKRPGFRDAQIKDGVHINAPTFIQNAFELLGTPGQWYLDRPAHTLYYVPLPGEDMASAEVLVPVVEVLLEVKGTLDEPVRNIRFEGLGFSHTTFLRPRTIGHAEVQANFLKDPDADVDHTAYLKTPAGVVLDAARYIVFERCTLSRFGATALDIQNGSRENTVRGCVFEQIGAGGVQIGDVGIADAHPTDERTVVWGNTVDNCYLHAIGEEFKGSIGIFVGYAGGTAITHNEITDVGYSGISVGWGWGFYDPWAEPDVPLHYHPGKYPRFDTPTTCRDNIVQHNHVHHVLQRLHDGGGIYTLGRMDGSTIRDNHVHDTGAGRGGPGGIYLDEGSAGMEVAGNAVYNVQVPFNFHNTMPAQQSTMVEHDNFFGLGPDDANFPTHIAAHAGLEPAYRDLLQE